MKLRPKARGFTLVEVMLAVTASAILSLIVAMILFATYRSWRTNNEYVRLRRDEAFAVQLMAKDIRAASFSGIDAGENYLELDPNVVRPNLTRYQRNSTNGILTYYVSGAEQGPVITAGLRRFNPVITNEGVLLHLELANDDGDIVITNKTFIYARN